MATTSRYGVELECSYTFRLATDAQIAAIANGCGDARTRWVPDRIWGVYIGFVCFIHDWDYCYGRTEGHRRIADRRMLMNMLTVIEARTAYQATRVLCDQVALSYYEAVRSQGGGAFWAGKG